MKTQFTKIFAVIFCSIIFASIIHAQDKSEATLFASLLVSSKETKIDRLSKTLEKLAGRLNKEPETTKGFVSVPTNTELGEKVKLFFAKAGLENRVSFLNDAKYPKYHNFGYVYFLIVPQGAEVPAHFKADSCICPTFDVIGHRIVIGRDSALIFKAKVGDEDIEGLSYSWQVSAGKIIDGQGTSVIKVDAQGADEITATVQVSGFCENCIQTTSETTKLP